MFFTFRYISEPEPAFVACISVREASEKENPPTITVPEGEKFFALSNIFRSGCPLAAAGLFVPSEPTSVTDSTRIKRLRYFSGLSCLTETSSVQRPAVTRSLAVTSLCVRLSPVVAKTNRVTVSASPEFRPIETVKPLFPGSEAPTPDTAVPTRLPEASSHWIA